MIDRLWKIEIYCRGVGTNLKLGGPNIDIQGGPYFTKNWLGPTICFALFPPSPYPYYAPALVKYQMAIPSVHNM